MALAQEKWEKETEDEFAQIKADHERAALELNKKACGTDTGAGTNMLLCGRLQIIKPSWRIYKTSRNIK